MATLSSNQLIGLSKGIDAKEISGIGKDKLYAIVDKIEGAKIVNLGNNHLSSMMGRLNSSQIGELDKEKKISIVDGLQANFFATQEADFNNIRSANITIPTLDTAKIGKTKIAAVDSVQKERVRLVLTRNNLFSGTASNSSD